MDKYLVKCKKIDDFGRGIAFLDGKVMFIPDLLPNEEAYVIKTLDKKKYSLGKVVSFVLKSDDRVLSKCKNDDCGCSLKHLKYEKALEYKNEKVKNIFKKFASLDDVVLKIVYGDKKWNYRNKVTLKVKGKCGYFKNNSHEFVPIDRHELAKEDINNIISILNKEDLSNVSEVIIKAYDEIMVVIKGYMDISNLKKPVSSIYMNDKLVYGSKYIYNHIGDLKFLVGPEAFFQVNDDVTLMLYNKVLDYLPKDKNKTVLDLYCGTGTISLFLSKYYKNVIGIEINKDAYLCANLNKEINDIKNVNFICGDVSKEIDNLKADIVVVDPPRAGLSKEGIRDILKINPEEIVYVSCDPVTLARDINLLNGYKVVSDTPFDMFPMTYHVENVCLLKRDN